MNIFAIECIQDHRNPLLKLSLPAQKLFFTPTLEEKEHIKMYQQKLKAILKHKRVDRRSNRAQVIWNPEKKMGQVVKVVKNIAKYIGYHNKNGMFLFPEEILYLLENNKLEVTFDGFSLTIKEAVEILFSLPSLNLTKYRIYKKLAVLGYKLCRYNSKLEMPLKTIQSNVKRKLEDDEHEGSEKHPRLTEDNNSGHSVEAVSKEKSYIEKIFRVLKANAPRNNQEESLNEPDYSIFAPCNIGTKSTPDFNLILCNSRPISTIRGFHRPTDVYAMCSDDVSFYRFATIKLPDLEL